MQVYLLLTLLLLVAGAIPASLGQQSNQTATAPSPAEVEAALRARCNVGYTFVPKAEADAYNKAVGWSYDQALLPDITANKGKVVSCACDAGFGSHLPGRSTGSNLPSRQPQCSYFLPRLANDKDCRCRRCPAGYTSKGGPLNSRAAACVKGSGGDGGGGGGGTTPGSAKQKAYFKLRIRSRKNPCSKPVQGKVAKALADEVKNSQKAARNVKAAAQSCKASKTKNMYDMVLMLEYQGPRTVTDILISEAETNVCDLGVCPALKPGTITRADGQSSPFDPPSPPPPKKSPRPSPKPSPKPAFDCVDYPDGPTPNSGGFPTSCINRNEGQMCTASCTGGATGDGYTATCIGNNEWDIIGNCRAPPSPSPAPSRCSSAPAATTDITNKTTGWPASCAGVVVNGICTAPCNSRHTGAGYTVRCTAKDIWSSPTGSCNVKTCSGLPAAPSNGSAWPPTCANAAVGTTCTSNCSAAATGTGYTATCDVMTSNWTVSGSCTPKLCPAVPPTAAQAAAWNTTCAARTVGSICTTACLANATGTGYTATCADTNTWNVSGSCVVKSCAAAPSNSLAPFSNGFNATACGNVTLGGTCQAACDGNSTGGGYTATCRDTNSWNVTGSCGLRPCSTSPVLQPNSGSWINSNGSNCTGAASGGICRSNCTASITLGSGYTATCVMGNWTYGGNCTLKTCSNMPQSFLAPNSVGWPNGTVNGTTNSTSNSTISSTCVGTSVGNTCRAACDAVSAGTGYVAVCNDTNTWLVTGNCTIRGCPLPPPANLTLSVGWGVNCTNTTNFGNCTARCSAGATGPGYFASCQNGAWTNVTGSCIPKTCFTQQPALQFNQGDWICVRPNVTTNGTTNGTSGLPSLGANCTAACAANSTGIGYIATCVDDEWWPGMPNTTFNGTVNGLNTTGWTNVTTPTVVFGSWRVTGACVLRTCAGQPPQPLHAAVTWNASCANLTAGSNCSLPCAANATGVGYAATCVNGNWTVTGACSLKTCAPTPPLSINGSALVNREPANWDPNCTFTAGSTCQMPCAVNATGGYNATCGIDGNWTVAGMCALTQCPGLPPDIPLSAGWSPSCNNTVWGTVCTANCTPNAVGGYSALCRNQTWTVLSNQSCLLRTCPGLPPPQNLTTGWDPGCAGANYGTVCEARCTANATGSWQAVCGANGWSVFNATLCELKACQGLPAAVPTTLSPGWSDSCAGLKHGQRCNATCTVNASGLYQSECFEGAWTQPVTSCAYKRCPMLPPVPPLAASSWNISFANSTIGSVMSLPCFANNATGPGFTAACLNNGSWEVTGNCSLKMCLGLPPAAVYAAPWPDSCSNATHNSTCSAACNSNATGAVQAACWEGAWALSNATSCSLKRCPALPPRPPRSASDWNASYSNATVTTVMQLPCSPNNTVGTGYVATCLEYGNWSVVGSCEPKLCAQPPDAALASLSTGWLTNCTNRTAGSICTAACAVNAFGSGYSATCNEGSWAVTGLCEVKRCSSSPPAASNPVPNSIGWGNCTTNATYGTSCVTACNPESFGTGYTATCIGIDQWSTNNGSCTRKLCQGVPPDRNNSANIAAFGSSWYLWKDGVKQPCHGNVVGSQCVADCAPNTEGLGFGAECKVTGSGGQWASWGTCAEVLCTGSSPAPIEHSDGWVLTGSASTPCPNPAPPGTRCEAKCSPVSGIGEGWFAECRLGTWSSWGVGCNSVRCSGLPALTVNFTLGWNPGCNNSAAGTTCQAVCDTNFTSGGFVTASCVRSGNTASWSGVSGTCTRKRCSANPTAAAPANTLGWSGCISLPVGDETCQAVCNSTYAFQSPVAPTARCTDTDTWSYSGACTRKCPEIFRPQPPNNTVGWQENCSNTRLGDTCYAPCRPPFSAAKWSIFCNAVTGTWETPVPPAGLTECPV